MKILVVAVLALSFAGQSFAQDTVASQQAGNQIQAPVTAPAAAADATVPAPGETQASNGNWGWLGGHGALVGFVVVAGVTAAVFADRGHSTTDHGTTGTAGK